MDTNEKISSKKPYLIAYGVFFVILLAVVGVLVTISKSNPELPSAPEVVNSGLVQLVQTETGTTEEKQDEKTIEGVDDLYSIDVFEVRDKLDVGDYDSVINMFEGLEEMTEADRSLYFSALLNKGNYYYENAEMAAKVQKYLEGIENKTWNDYYYLGYSKEVTKDYTGAIESYNQALEIALDSSDKSIITNQIGHVYDLSGENDKAFTFYFQANELDSNNSSAKENLGRYHLRKGELEKAKELFNELVISADVDSTSKAEIYYTLAEIEMDGYDPDIEKMIELANKGIENFADYPMNYIALAKANLLKDDIKYYPEVEKNLDKAIELNPDSFDAYRLYGWYYFERMESENDFFNSMEALNVAKENLLKDMILMDNDRGNYYFGIMDDVATITLVTQIWGDLDKQIELLQGNLEIQHPYIEFQLKRENYGIFENIKDEPKFQEIISKLN